MKFQLGPMSVGDIFDRSLKLLFSRLAAFATIILLVMLPMLTVNALLPLAQSGDPGQEALVALFSLLVIMAHFFVLLPLGQAGCLHLVANEIVDRRVGMGEALDFVVRRLLPILGAAVLVALIVWGTAFAGAFVMGCLAGFMLAAAGAAGAAANSVFGILVILLVFLGMSPAVIFMIWFGFAPQVVVVENHGPVQALTRSRQLGEGYRWRIFGMILLLLAVRVIVALTVMFGMRLLLPYSEQVITDFLQEEVVTNYPNYLINVAVQAVFNVLVECFVAVCWTMLYIDLRIRKEAWDLELAVEAPPLDALPVGETP